MRSHRRLIIGLVMGMVLFVASCGGPKTTEAARNPTPETAGGGLTVAVVQAETRQVAAAVQLRVAVVDCVEVEVRPEQARVAAQH